MGTSTTKPITFTLDGDVVIADGTQTIWEIAKSRGTTIPHLCHRDEPGYRSDGNCRACMVEIEGERTLAASCIRTPTEGMVVSTETARATTARRSEACQDLRRAYASEQTEVAFGPHGQSGGIGAGTGAQKPRKRLRKKPLLGAGQMQRAIIFAGLMVFAMGQTILFALLGPATREMGFAEWQVGAIISPDHMRKIDGYVQDAVADGAHVAVGGAALEVDGLGAQFYQPTVVTNLREDMAIARDEVFGPVAAIQTFNDNDDIVARANDTEYGLVAYLYTGDMRRGLALSEQLDFGMSGLNRGLVSDPSAPFGGVKQSGLGREGGKEGLHEFQETQYISTEW